MLETADSNSGGVFRVENDTALESRIFLVMAVSVALAVICSAPFTPWRVTTGLMLGGLLSLFNYHWLRSSISALIEANVSDKNVGHRASRYVIRYAVVGVLVFTAYKVGIVSLAATIIGLCSFVIALFAEALREFYFAIIHREGIN